MEGSHSPGGNTVTWSRNSSMPATRSFLSLALYATSWKICWADKRRHKDDLHSSLSAFKRIYLQKFLCHCHKPFSVEDYFYIWWTEKLKNIQMQMSVYIMNLLIIITSSLYEIENDFCTWWLKKQILVMSTIRSHIWWSRLTSIGFYFRPPLRMAANKKKKKRKSSIWFWWWAVTLAHSCTVGNTVTVFMSYSADPWRPLLSPKVRLSYRVEAVELIRGFTWWFLSSLSYSNAIFNHRKQIKYKMLLLGLAWSRVQTKIK